MIAVYVGAVLAAFGLALWLAHRLPPVEDRRRDALDSLDVPPPKMSPGPGEDYDG